MRRNTLLLGGMPLLALAAVVEIQADMNKDKHKPNENQAPPLDVPSGSQSAIKPDVALSLPEKVKLLHGGKLWSEQQADSGVVIIRYKSATEDLAFAVVPGDGVKFSNGIHQSAAYVNKYKPKKKK